MRYRIEECVVCGIKNPRLILIGWIENTCNKIVVKDSNGLVFSEKLEKIRSRVSTFHINHVLNSSKDFYIYAYKNSQEMELLETIHSTVTNRVSQKYKPKFQFSFIHNLQNRYFKSYKLQSYDDSWDMRKDKEYRQWIAKYELFSEVKKYTYNPLISIVMPVYNVPGEYLSYCIDSILSQTYQNFEICIADDCSTNQDTVNTLYAYMKRDKRVKVVFREKNGHISEATNSALSLASGEFIGLMDNDDTLAPQALNEVVKVLNEQSNVDFVYTDEDKIDMQGNRSDPHFKANYSLDSLYGGNYICHFSVIRKKLIDKIGGFRKGYEGAQDFDLFLRLTNETKHIYHIPKVLYHWRMIPGSTALSSSSKNYAGEAGKRALEDYFSKKDIAVNIEILVNTHYFVEYVLEKEPKLEILICAKNNIKEVNQCLAYIAKDTVYENYDSILLSEIDVNISNSESNNVKTIKYSSNQLIRALNTYIQQSKAEYIAVVDSGTIIQTFDWADVMIGYAKQEKIGVVGCKVLNSHYYVCESGIVFTENTQPMSATLKTFRTDYGYNGKLLVPHNYSSVTSACYLFNRKKAIEIGLFDESLSYEYAAYDLNLKMLKMGYKNVFIPQVEVINDSFKSVICEEENIYFISKWKEYFENDPYYNDNLSKKDVYRLDK